MTFLAAAMVNAEKFGHDTDVEETFKQIIAQYKNALQNAGKQELISQYDALEREKLSKTTSDKSAQSLISVQRKTVISELAYDLSLLRLRDLALSGSTDDVSRILQAFKKKNDTNKIDALIRDLVLVNMQIPSTTTKADDFIAKLKVPDNIKTKIQNEYNAINAQATTLASNGITKNVFLKQLDTMNTIYEIYALNVKDSNITVRDKDVKQQLKVYNFGEDDVDLCLKTIKSMNYNKLSFTEKVAQVGLTEVIIKAIIEFFQSEQKYNSKYEEFGAHLSKVIAKEKATDVPSK